MECEFQEWNISSDSSALTTQDLEHLFNSFVDRDILVFFFMHV